MAIAMTTKVKDIRETLPVAVKSGTAAKPLWIIDGVHYKFVRSVKKNGLDSELKMVRLGKRVLAKYKVLSSSPTVPGGVLWFVGVFAAVPVKAK